jgi:antitoxin CcdA
MTEATRRQKRATNLTGLGRALREREAEEWLKRNRAALDAYNAQMEKHGVFSEGLRSF